MFDDKALIRGWAQAFEKVSKEALEEASLYSAGSIQDSFLEFACMADVMHKEAQAGNVPYQGDYSIWSNFYEGYLAYKEFLK